METYRYKAKTADGANVSGVLEAYSEYDAVAELKEKYRLVTSIERVKESKRQGSPVLGKERIKDKDLSVLCSQFSIILTSGLPIVKCVEMVAAQTKDKKLKKVLYKVRDDVNSGHSLARSFEKNSSAFPATFIETIRAGEQSGTLEECFGRLQKYYDKQHKVHAKLVSTMIYPTMVIIVGIVVFIIIMVVAVPMFVETFESLDTDLPAITKALIAISNAITGYWWLALIIVALAIGAYVMYSRTESGKRRIAKFRLTRSPLRKLNSMNCASRFGNTMATLLAAGMPVNEALGSTANVVGNYIFSIGVGKVRQEVEQGHSMSQAMSGIEYFPGMLVEMTGVGESSGSLEETFGVIGDYYANETDIASKRLLSMLEPAITIVIAIFAVVLLMAVYLPLFSMYEAF